MAEHSHSHDHITGGDHSHSHPHFHSHNYSDANKEHFDDLAAERYERQPGAVELAKRLGEAMIEKYPLVFDESKTVVMDYACGTGKRV
jgi:hypothetical protein